mmetsp:Transcript_17022/g.38989  ORF Transcript_17022/g.38989 Transcript_17022/m.38989 type:complete len:285 (-) Transcript_17022:251-1105(-)
MPPPSAPPLLPLPPLPPRLPLLPLPRPNRTRPPPPGAVFSPPPSPSKRSSSAPTPPLQRVAGPPSAAPRRAPPQPTSGQLPPDTPHQLLHDTSTPLPWLPPPLGPMCKTTPPHQPPLPKPPTPSLLFSLPRSSSHHTALGEESVIWHKLTSNGQMALMIALGNVMAVSLVLLGLCLLWALCLKIYTMLRRAPKRDRATQQGAQSTPDALDKLDDPDVFELAEFPPDWSAAKISRHLKEKRARKRAALKEAHNEARNPGPPRGGYGCDDGETSCLSYSMAVDQTM